MPGLRGANPRAPSGRQCSATGAAREVLAFDTGGWALVRRAGCGRGSGCARRARLPTRPDRRSRKSDGGLLCPSLLPKPRAAAHDSRSLSLRAICEPALTCAPRTPRSPTTSGRRASRARSVSEGGEVAKAALGPVAASTAAPTKALPTPKGRRPRPACAALRCTGGGGATSRKWRAACETISPGAQGRC